MKKVMLTVMLLVGALACGAEEQPADMNELYREIDKAIEESPVYVARYDNEINKVKTAYRGAKGCERQMVLALQLFDLYHAFNNDSALYYISRCIELAEGDGRPDMVAEAQVKKAFQCSTVGLYTEARELLDQIDTKALSHEGMGSYYLTRMHLCGEIASYSHLPEVSQRYFVQREVLRDSAMAYLTPGSHDYLMIHQDLLINQGRFEDALKVNDEWQNSVQEGTHEHAIAAYYRHIVYDKLGNEEKTKLWLAKSALDDIRCAVMDQASLVTLSSLLNSEGDLDRSYRYIRFTWECNDRFNTRMRYWQLSPILTVIEKNYQDQADRNNSILTLGAVGALAMLVAILLLLYRNIRQKHKLLRAQQDLQESNAQLTNANEKLQLMNEQIVRYNQKLFAINKELQESYTSSTFNKDEGDSK